MGNPSNLPYICSVWSPQIGNLMIPAIGLACWKPKNDWYSWDLPTTKSGMPARKRTFTSPLAPLASSKLEKSNKWCTVWWKNKNYYGFLDFQTMFFFTPLFLQVYPCTQDNLLMIQKRLQAFFRLQDAGGRYHIHHKRPWNSSQVEVEACLCQIPLSRLADSKGDFWIISVNMVWYSADDTSNHKSRRKRQNAH